MIYAKNTIYVIGTAKISSNDPISAMFDMFFIGIILERENGKIVDLTCNMVRDVTADFIKSMLIDYNLIEDIDQIVEEIKDRFHGIAQKAVIAAVKDARNKYMMLKK
ncbi:protein of unknown function [Geosporobacter subterraneus DSM 17957]|uniref:DUF3870 domain-containing protein n=1 Tax=Geosporobacter subterraneus DSM 17957 TaxID=1121919 RepID=A0A1M6ED90_9FIRM|nr:DUF3870 domain-containing protein [Geosporobacter subterraneus]SHI83446.1 protein of unknown function [Geosporobacter subterraneus DSM 17957]